MDSDGRNGAGMTPDRFTVTLTETERDIIARLCLGTVERGIPEAFDVDSTLSGVVAAMDQDQRRVAADACTGRRLR